MLLALFLWKALTETASFLTSWLIVPSFPFSLPSSFLLSFLPSLFPSLPFCLSSFHPSPLLAFSLWFNNACLYVRPCSEKRAYNQWKRCLSFPQGAQKPLIIHKIDKRFAIYINASLLLIVSPINLDLTPWDKKYRHYSPVRHRQG